MPSPQGGVINLNFWVNFLDLLILPLYVITEYRISIKINDNKSNVEVGLVAIEKDRVCKAIQELKRFYEGLSFEPLVWQRDGNMRDPHRALIVMGLSQQTSDDNVTRVCKKFFLSYPTASDLIKAWHLNRDEVLSIVNPLGNHRRSCQILEAAINFGTEIPSEAADVQRPGIAETTAEKVVGYGYGKAALPLDSHG